MNYESMYRQSIDQKEAFWAEQAALLPWYRQPQQIISNTLNGFYEWFADGITNMCYLCVDRHVAEGRGEQTAIAYDAPAFGTSEQITYRELQNTVAAFAKGLLNLGVRKGDTVIIYMPMIPQALVAMLACARIGAIHSVVFGGFAPHELAVRIDDAKPRVIISASYGVEFGKKIPYKTLVDEAIAEARHKPDYQVYYRREEGFDNLGGPGELDYEALLSCGTTDCVPVASTHPLYILYTSGTTGRPKGIVRDTGGYATALRFSMEYIYNVQQGDVFWAASDIGWVVGHSYIVYAPLLHGCTTVLYEGKPVRTPDAGAFWRVIEQYRVNVLFTAPTSIRAIKKEDHNGSFLREHNIGSLHSLFLAGERCDPDTFGWIQQLLQKPVIDHWWQTESGWPMLSLMTRIDERPGLPGSAGFPVCGYDIRILDEQGAEVEAKQEGNIAIRLPLPPGCLPGLWNNEIRFRKSYLERYPGYYLSGDGGYKNEEGYVFVMGRIDDVINVSGHRLSTGEMEEIVSAHPAVAECAVVGIACALRGQRPLALIVLKDGIAQTEADLQDQLVHTVRETIGPIAVFKTAVVVKRLPKTRSGKILRKTISEIADGKAYTIPSTIDDPEILNEIKEKLLQRRVGIAFDEAI
ncbi:AMP-binding protein [Rurimicrobium arvi]|uniref:Propionyl-CoA synthetase n=1 Tax=Rurimicrobium arvi TaxID=2049916 RepID=A0ABP8N2X7_9BACT